MSNTAPPDDFAIALEFRPTTPVSMSYNSDQPIKSIWIRAGFESTLFHYPAQKTLNLYPFLNTPSSLSS